MSRDDAMITTSNGPQTRTASRRRIAAVRRAAAVVFAVGWLLPGFGIPDLLVTWDPAWSQVLEAGWGLYMTVLLALPLLVIAVAPRMADDARLQLLVAASALVVAAVATAEWRLAVLAALVVIEVIVVAGPPRTLALARPGRAWPVLVLGAFAAPAAVAYAAAVWRPELQRLPDADYTLDIDHLSVQGALAIAVITLALLVPFRSRGRVLLGISAGTSAFYLGIVSWAWPHSAAAMPPAWSLACASWGVSIAVLAVAFRRPGPSRRGRARPRRHGRGWRAPGS